MKQKGHETVSAGDITVKTFDSVIPFLVYEIIHPCLGGGRNSYPLRTSGRFHEVGWRAARGTTPQLLDISTYIVSTSPLL